MSRVFRLLATLALALSLAACAGSPKSSDGCCPMCSSEGKAMKCEKKEHAGGCCSKGTEGKAQEGHQH